MHFFEIYIRDEEGNTVETLKVKRVKRSKHFDLFNLLKEPLYVFFRHNWSIGAVISNESYWKDLKKIAAMFPIMGEEKVGFDLDRIEEDYDQITQIFFTTSEFTPGMFQSGDTASSPKPSLLAQLHYFDYQGELAKVGTRLVKELKAQAQADGVTLEPELQNLVTE
jgi:hypothetical protein